MKRFFSRAALLAAALVSICSIWACATTGPGLRVGPAGQIPKNLRGDLILFGGRYTEDLYTMAILVVEGSPYKIVPYAPAFDYEVIKNIGAPEAVDTSARFFRATNPNLIDTKRMQVLGPDGNVIAYEIRPLYQPVVYGISDVLETNYWVKSKGLVNVWINITPSLNRQLQDNERPNGIER